MKKQLQDILEDYANYVYYEGDPKRGGIDLDEATEKLCSLFLKEYEKRKPKKVIIKEPVTYTPGEHISPYQHANLLGFNDALKSVDQVIYEMLKIK